VGKHDWLPSIQVGGDNREGYTQILKLFGIEDAFDQVAEAVVAGQAQAGDVPAADVAKLQGPAGRHDASQWGAAGIGRAENAAHAGARDAGYRNVMLFEDLQNAEVREAARKTAT
jgi:hypothetical protein